MNVKIIIHSELISLYYSQTLCLMLWPRAKFPDLLPEDFLPRVEFFEEVRDNFYTASVKIYDEHGEYNGSFSSFAIEKCYMETSAFVAGRAFYEAAKKCGMKSNPWGLLTGIRPAKPILSALREGKSIDGFYSLLTDDYLLSGKKAELCAEVAKTEYECIKGIKNDTCSIYISVPFCPTRCAYCSFVSYALPNLMALIPEYVEHLCLDIQKTAEVLKRLGIKVISVYIGGGTPTTLDSEKLYRLISAVNSNFDISGLAEFCVEAGRPDTIDREKLMILKNGGVNRISINPQTLHDSTLKTIGRRHSVDDFYRAYELASSIGFDCKNVDLILGLPDETGDDFRESIDGILSLAPENITVHSFCVKKSADLASVDEIECADIYLPQLEAFEKIKSGGYRPYYIYRQKNAVGNLENAGFSVPGKEGIYNIMMMEEIHSVIGLGAGASTRLVSRSGKSIERFYAPKYPFEYKSYDIENMLNFTADFYENKYYDNGGK